MAKTWKGAPPIYIAISSAERVVDAARISAQTAAKSGVTVLWDEYELMPHNWPMILPESVYPHTRRCYETWAQACLAFSNREPLKTVGRVTDFDTLEAREIDVERLTPITRAEVEELFRKVTASLKPVTLDTLKSKSLL